jgi:hypothetical protein
MRPAPLTGLPGRYRLGIADCRYWAGRVALRENPRTHVVSQVREELKRRG